MGWLTKGVSVTGFGTQDTTFGLVESLEVKDEADKIEIENGEGDVVGLIFKKLRTAVSGSFSLKKDQTFDKTIGGDLSIPVTDTETIAIVVDSVSRSYKRGEVTVYSFEGTAYPEMSDASSST